MSKSWWFVNDSFFFWHPNGPGGLERKQGKTYCPLNVKSSQVYLYSCVLIWLGFRGWIRQETLLKLHRHFLPGLELKLYTQDSWWSSGRSLVLLALTFTGTRWLSEGSRAHRQRGRDAENEQRETAGQRLFDRSDRGWLKWWETRWERGNIWNPHHNKPNIDICNNSYLLIANNTKHFTFLGLSYSPFLFWKVKYQVTSTKLMPIQVSLSMWATNLKICRHLPADALRDIILTSKVNPWVRGFCVRKCFFCVTSVWMWVCIQRPSHKGPFN